MPGAPASTASLNFNLCSNTNRKCTLADGDYDEDFGNILLQPSGKCHRLSEDDMDESQAEYIDQDKPEVGIKLIFTSTEPCDEVVTPLGGNVTYYGMTIDLRCDEEATNPIPRIKSESVAKNQCHPVVYMNT